MLRSMSLARVCCRMRKSAFIALALLLLPVPVLAQTYTITPPNYPGMNVPFPYLYLNGAAHWGYMSPQNANSGASAWLQTVPLTRVVGSVHWPNIAPESSSTTWSTALASIGIKPAPTNCSSDTADESLWWPMASCWGTAGTSSSNPNNLLYTFYLTPYWASQTNGTHRDGGTPSSITGWDMASAPTINSGTCTTGTCNVTLYLSTTGGTNLANYKSVIVNISNGSTYTGYTVEIPNGGLGTYTTDVQPITVILNKTVATPTQSNTYVTYTQQEPPSDVPVNGVGGNTCPTLVDGSDGGTGDCIFKNYVTWIMMQTCNRTSKPTSPLSTCVIHYFEGWNEFNTDTFWRGNNSQLARMMIDGQAIVKAYCSDCFWIAGSVSAGGDAGHNIAGTSQQYNTAGTYVEALGELLTQWHDLAPNSPPDAISMHPYADYDNIYMPPMPEVNTPASTIEQTSPYAPTSWDPSVSGYGTLATCNTTSGAAGCVNICGYSNNYGKWSGSSCSAYIENPPSGSPYGTAAPGCSAQNQMMTYVKATSFTPPSPWFHCRDSFVNSLRATRQMLTDIVSVGDLPSGWLSASTTPIWNTESGPGPYSDYVFPGLTPKNSTILDPYDTSLTTFYTQSYIARLSILGAESTAAMNLWYQWDENTTYTCDPNTSSVCNEYPAYMQGIPGISDNLWQSGINWGQLGNNFVEGSQTTTNTGTFQPTRAAYTFNRVYHWLLGATFDGVAPSGVWQANHSYAQNDIIYDGVNIQKVKTAGTSGGSAPSWHKGVYDTTSDNTVVWENMGDKNCNDTSTFNSSGYLNPGVWACYISKTSPAGYQATIYWVQPFDTVVSVETPSGEQCLRDIDGNLIYETAGSFHRILNRPAMFDNSSSTVCKGTAQGNNAQDGLPEKPYQP